MADEHAQTTQGNTRTHPTGAHHIHWHVAFTHFPVSLFATAFLFQMLHFFMFEDEFELATTVCVISGAASLVPAIASGWTTWKRRYHASTTRLFRRKIVLGFTMLAVSVPLAGWRVLLYQMDHPLDIIDHYIFFAVTTALIAAAMVEGYLGGKLSHH